MKAWTFFSAATGEHLGRAFIGSESALAINTPVGAVAVEGNHDADSTRLDLVSGLVVAAVQPLELEAQIDRIAILTKLRALDLVSLRPLAEVVSAMAAGQDANEAALQKLSEIEAEKEALRADLQ